jgi:hypothetical protein
MHVAQKGCTVQLAAASRSIAQSAKGKLQVTSQHRVRHCVHRCHCRPQAIEAENLGRLAEAKTQHSLKLEALGKENEERLVQAQVGVKEEWGGCEGGHQACLCKVQMSGENTSGGIESNMLSQAPLHDTAGGKHALP